MKKNLVNIMELILAILFILIVLALILIYCDKDNAEIYGLAIALLTFFFATCLATYNEQNTPTAIDVYNGKTTLEITYRDGVAIDTVVVFKSEYKKI